MSLSSNIKSTASPATTTNSSLISRSGFKFAQLLLLHSSGHNTFPPPHYHHEEEEEEEHSSRSSSSSISTSRRPSHDSDKSSHSSPNTKSPWLIKLSPLQPHHNNRINLIGSLLLEEGEGHVYSLATSSQFLYTGSDSKNIRIWTKSRLRDSGGFKPGSGLVKSIIVSPHDSKIFTGHQDGKIRVWQAPQDIMISSSSSHRRVGSLPTWKDSLKSLVDPRSEVRTRRHFDAVSCLSLDKDTEAGGGGLLYSASWDKTIKVWRLKDSCKCVDSIKAHDDAVNAVVAAGFGRLVFSGSADGTVKVWRRENHGKNTFRHVYMETLMEQSSAVTSLAVMTSTGTLYAGSSDGLVSFWVWDKLTGIMRYGGVLRGHKLAVLCLTTAGSLVLSGAADATVCVWRRDDVGVGGDHVCLSVLTGHTGPVKCLAVDEDFGDSCSDEQADEANVEMVRRCQRWRVYSGSVDNSVRIWMVLQDDHLTTPSDS